MGKLSLRGGHGAFKEAYRRLVAVQGPECSSPDNLLFKVLLENPATWYPAASVSAHFWALGFSHVVLCRSQRPQRKESSPTVDTWRWWTEALWGEGGFTLDPFHTHHLSCSSASPPPRPPQSHDHSPWCTGLGNKPQFAHGENPGILTAVHICNDSFFWQVLLS